MSVPCDLTGQRFGRLAVINRRGSSRQGKAMWFCRCDCGQEVVVRSRDLKSGGTKSCGCPRTHVVTARCLTHGHSRRGMRTQVYRVWYGMIQRCNNPKQPSYYRYGGRGITVCKRWRKFENLLKDMGEPPTDRHQIDRIDNDKGYCKSNCRWVTPQENSRNTRRNCWLMFKGRRQCVAAWAEEMGICPAVLQARLRLGWSVERALTKPVRNGKGRGESHE